MDKIWMNSLCRDTATQVVKKAINVHMEETLDKHFKEIAEALRNVEWENLMQEVLHDQVDFVVALKNCSHCKKEFPSSLLTGDPRHYGLYCHECYSIMLETYKITCAKCQQKHLYWEGSKYFCATCNTHNNHQELLKVQKQNRRAKNKNLASTLTLYQWMETLNYFKWSCAYCQGIYYALEHYNPLPYGGTTQKNCFPVCRQCNTRKNNKLPEEFEPLFPAENIYRIKEYRALLESA